MSSKVTEETDDNRITAEEPHYEARTQADLEDELTRRPMTSQRFRHDGENLIYQDAPLSEYATQRLSAMAGVPTHFLPKCSPLLATRILSEFLGRNERPIDFLQSKDGSIASFLWSDYVYIPVAGLEQAIQSALPNENMKIVKSRPGISGFTTFITEANAFKVIQKDDIHFGLGVQGSMDGGTSTKLTLAFYRPICTNGAKITEASWSLPRRSIKSVETALFAVAEAAVRVFALSDQWKENTRILAGQSVDQPEEELVAMMHRLGLSSRIADFVLDAYNAEPNPTMWGLMNALTRAANQVPTTSLAESLWSSAGIIVKEANAPCKTCGHVFAPGEAVHVHQMSHINLIS